MGLIHTSRRRAAAVTIAVLAAVLALVPAASAEQKPTPGWYGWGVKFKVENGAPKVTFTVYVAQDGATPQVIASDTDDITSSCVARGSGSITYSANSATFDGASYLRCALPSWADASYQLGYPLPSGEMSCPAGGAPTWGDFEARPRASVTGTMPLLDASSVGLRLSLVSNGTQAQARLDIARVLGGAFSSYDSPRWTVSSNANARAVVGLHGRGIVAVADNFGWLNYLTSPAWRTFYRANVTGTRVGSWVESPGAASSNQAGRDYELGTTGGPLYIGYSPASGRYFDGTIGPGGTTEDPGCQGL
jgi:hypothetical protein